jgi:CBS domain-containing protein
MPRMKVRDVMTSPAITVTPETPFASVAATLVEHDISGAPVIDEAGRLVGVVSEADLLDRQVHGRRQVPGLWTLLSELVHGRYPYRVHGPVALTAAELMTPGIDIVAPDDDVQTATRRMVDRGHRRLAVIDDGAVVGVISRHDVLRPFVRDDVEVLTEVRRVLADPFRVAEDHAVRPSVRDGVVTIDGTVRRPGEEEIVEAEVLAVPGVVAVDNHLRAREQAPLAPHLRHW